MNHKIKPMHAPVTDPDFEVAPADSPKALSPAESQVAIQRGLRMSEEARGRLFFIRPKREGYAHRKYRPGPVIKTFAVLADAAKRGAWVFFEDRAYHSGWVCNWQMRTLQWHFERGAMRMAIRNKTVPLQFRAVFINQKGNEPVNWWLSCDEIPGFSHGHEPFTMESAIDTCNKKAKALGHFGRVQVLFEREGEL